MKENFDVMDLGLPTPRGSMKWNLDSVQRLIKAIEEGKFDVETGLPTAAAVPTE